MRRRHHRKQPGARAEKGRHAPLLKGSEKPATARIVGYARVSTEEQRLDVQITALKDAGAVKIYVEKISAVNAKRPQFNLMMKQVERGDSVLFHSLSRMGRDVTQINTILNSLTADGIAWRSLTEPHLDNKTASGRLMLNITGAMAQFERDQIVDRTLRGMAECERRGMRLGRQKIVSDAVVAKMARLRLRGWTAERILARYPEVKITISTLYARTNEWLRAQKKA